MNPGNAGRMYLPYVGKKITKLLAMKEDMDFEIYWDGACSAGKILEYAPKGVKGFVLGITFLRKCLSDVTSEVPPRNVLEKYFPAAVCRGECAGNVPGRMLLFSLLRWELFSSIIEPSFTQLKFGTGNRHDLQENP